MLSCVNRLNEIQKAVIVNQEGNGEFSSSHFLFSLISFSFSLFSLIFLTFFFIFFFSLPIFPFGDYHGIFLCLAWKASTSYMPGFIFLNGEVE